MICNKYKATETAGSLKGEGHTPQLREGGRGQMAWSGRSRRGQREQAGMTG